MKDLSGKIAVVTGGGTGMGRELVRQLIANGCDVATCDIVEENLNETVALGKKEAPQGVRLMGSLCDVAKEQEVSKFREQVKNEFRTDHINLLFNNAGIGGGGSFVNSDQDEWERCFNICWFGVYNFSRAFLQMLVNSEEGHVINTSSVNGFRASLGGNIPHTAYSAAKFAVKGFTEALINDFRFNAPHLKASVVMPGWVGTDIALNTPKILGWKEPKDLSDEEIDEIRENQIKFGELNSESNFSNEEFRLNLEASRTEYKKAPVSSAQAAEMILEGVKNDKWRILIGRDAEALDKAVREEPLKAYDLDFSEKVWSQLNQIDP